MKKLLIVLSLTLFATSSFAQVSVVTKSAKTNSDGKVNNIADTTKKDLFVIEKKAEDWNDEFEDSQKDFDTSKNQISDVVNKLKKEDDEFLQDEKDPVYTKTNKTTPTYRDYSTKVVPVCSGNKPRLAYDGSNWVCKEAIDCNTINGNQEDWARITGPDGKPTCMKQKAGWDVGSWSKCNSSYKQTRTVHCRLFKDSDSKTPTGGIIHNDVCSGPEPVDSRNCANQ